MAATYWAPVTARPISAVAQVPASTPSGVTGVADQLADAVELAGGPGPEAGEEVADHLGRRQRGRVRLLHPVAEGGQVRCAPARRPRRPRGRSAPSRRAASATHPMRSDPGSAPTSVGEGAGRAEAAQYGSPTAGPATASRSVATSRTDRVTASRATSPPHASPTSGPIGTRPRPGLSPTRPQALAGMRIEPPAVAGVAHGDHAGGDGRGRPAARPAGGAGRVPRVVGRAVGLGLGRRDEPQLRGVGLADDDQPRGAEPPDQRVVRRRHVARVAQRPAALVEREPGGGAVEVLQHERHAPERAVGEVALGVGQGLRRSSGG